MKSLSGLCSCIASALQPDSYSASERVSINVVSYQSNTSTEKCVNSNIISIHNSSKHKRSICNTTLVFGIYLKSMPKIFNHPGGVVQMWHHSCVAHEGMVLWVWKVRSPRTRCYSTSIYNLNVECCWLLVHSFSLPTQFVCTWRVATWPSSEPWSIVCVWQLLSIDAGQRMGTQCEIEFFNFHMDT